MSNNLFYHKQAQGREPYSLLLHALPPSFGLPKFNEVPLQSPDCSLIPNQQTGDLQEGTKCLLQSKSYPQNEMEVKKRNLCLAGLTTWQSWELNMREGRRGRSQGWKEGPLSAPHLLTAILGFAICCLTQLCHSTLGRFVSGQCLHGRLPAWEPHIWCLSFQRRKRGYKNNKYISICLLLWMHCIPGFPTSFIVMERMGMHSS